MTRISELNSCVEQEPSSLWRDEILVCPALTKAAKSRRRLHLKMLLVKRISIKPLCIVSLVLMSVGAIADDSKENQSKKGFSDHWWLSFEESMFSESDGVTVLSLPQGTRPYETKGIVATS